MSRILVAVAIFFSAISSFAQSRIKISKDKTGLLVTISGKPVLYYHTSEATPPPDSPSYYRRSGFIHPLYSPSGKILIDDFPAGHAHQHGIFMTWANTMFRGTQVDFWNQQSKKGTVKHEQLLSQKEEKNYAEIKTQLAHISLQHGKILEEIWTIRISVTGNHYIIDLYSDQSNITNDTLFINKYHYGGLAFRGSREWNEDDKKYFTNKWKIITSAGKDVLSANATHAEWVDASGLVENKAGGVTIFSDPANFRHPQALRVHPQMPYWAFSPMVEEGFAITPGEHYHSRYRLIVHDGFGDPEKISGLYSEWIKTLKN
jgi:hypothetical protein